MLRGFSGCRTELSCGLSLQNEDLLFTDLYINFSVASLTSNVHLIELGGLGKQQSEEVHTIIAIKVC